MTDPHRHGGPATLGLGIVGCGGAAADVARAVASVPGLAITGVCCRDLAAAESLAAARAARRVCDARRDARGGRGRGGLRRGTPRPAGADRGRRCSTRAATRWWRSPWRSASTRSTTSPTGPPGSGRTLGVFYEMRFAPVVIEAARLVRGGAIGRVTAVRIRTIIDKSPDYWSIGLSGRSQNPWRGQAARAGGGVVLMNSSHQLDIVAAVTGLAVTRVFGHPRHQRRRHRCRGHRGGRAGRTPTAPSAASSPGPTCRVPRTARPSRSTATPGQVVLEPYAGQLRVYLRRPWEGLSGRAAGWSRWSARMTRSWPRSRRSPRRR